MRTFPALTVPRALAATDDDVDLLLALVDDARPTGVLRTETETQVFFATIESRNRARQLVAESAWRDARAIDVPDEQWAERSQASIGAVRVGDIAIAPPWVTPPDAPIVVVIQPSMGFGTGHHASTRLCLWLLQRERVSGRRVADIGTGSGVLAVAAARLGAADVVGIDDDAEAIACAEDSVARNAVGDRVRLITAPLSPDLPLGRFDLVLANLTAEVLIRLSAPLANFAAPDGALILGGIEAADADRVAEVFGRQEFEVVDRADEEGWVAMSLRRAG
jgi:ribosomal protein L11 methyltransferase